MESEESDVECIIIRCRFKRETHYLGTTTPPKYRGLRYLCENRVNTPLSPDTFAVVRRKMPKMAYLSRFAVLPFDIMVVGEAILVLSNLERICTTTRLDATAVRSALSLLCTKPRCALGFIRRSVVEMYLLTSTNLAETLPTSTGR